MIATEEKPGYVYIPQRAWWALRKKFQQSLPRGEVTASYLGSVLGIEPQSVRPIYNALKTAGLLDDAGKPTELANRWKTDEEYPQVCDEIRHRVYEQELLDLFPEPSEDTSLVKGWFTKKYSQLGGKAAEKMAGFYKLLLEANPNPATASTASKRVSTAQAKPSGTKTRPQVRSKPQPHELPALSEDTAKVEPLTQHTSKNGLTLHIDIQIHISPETTTQQIDQIFESMAKHLNK